MDNKETETPNQPAQTEPEKTAPEQAEPAKSEPATAEPATQTAPAEPAAAEPAKAESAPKPAESTAAAPTQLAAGQAVASTPAADANSAAKKPNPNKNKIIVGCAIGGAVIVLVIVLLVIFLSGGGITISCTMDNSVMGIDMKGESNIHVVDGGISGGDITASVDLKTLSSTYKNYEKEIVDTVVEEYENRCKDHCSFTHDYAEGDYLKMTLTYDSEGIKEIASTSSLEGKSAQEIADTIKKNAEQSSGTTCRQL